MNGFKETNFKQEKEMVGGAIPVALMVALVPLGIQLLNSVVGGAKSLFSSSGVIKDKQSSYKWNSEPKIELL